MKARVCVRVDREDFDAIICARAMGGRILGIGVAVAWLRGSFDPLRCWPNLGAAREAESGYVLSGAAPPSTQTFPEPHSASFIQLACVHLVHFHLSL